MKSLVVVLILCLSRCLISEELCKTSATTYSSDIEAVLNLPAGTSLSFFDKHIAWMGDDAAVALIRMGATDKLSSPDYARKVLYVVRVAFDCPRCILQEENRTTRVSVLLLDTMESRVQDAQLRKEISGVREHIKKQLLAE